MSLSRRWLLSAAGTAFLANLSKLSSAHAQSAGSGSAPPPEAKSGGGPPAGGEDAEIVRQFHAALAAERKAGNVTPSEADVEKRLREIYEDRFKAKLACGELGEETLRRLRWQAYLMGALTLEMWRFEKAGYCKAGGTPRKVKVELKHIDHARDAFWNVSRKGSAVRRAIENSPDPKAKKALTYDDQQCPMC